MGDRTWEGGTLADLALTERMMGRLDEAAAHYAEALSILVEVGDRRKHARTLLGQAILERLRGVDPALPARKLDEARATAADLRNPVLDALLAAEAGHQALSRGEPVGVHLAAVRALESANPELVTARAELEEAAARRS